MQRPSSFPRDKTRKIFEFAKEKGLIKLPEPKRPNEVGKTDDPDYCCYHRMLGHPTEDCFLLKNVIEGLIKEGRLNMGRHLVSPPQPHARVKQTFTANVIHEVTLYQQLSPEIITRSIQATFSKPEETSSEQESNWKVVQPKSKALTFGASTSGVRDQRRRHNHQRLAPLKPKKRH